LASPLSRLEEIVVRIRVWQARRQPTGARREVQLRGAQLEIVAPLRLRIKIERRSGHERCGHGGGLRHVKDVLTSLKALRRVRRIIAVEDLEAKPERCCEAAGEIRADQRTG